LISSSKPAARHGFLPHAAMGDNARSLAEAPKPAAQAPRSTARQPPLAQLELPLK